MNANGSVAAFDWEYAQLDGLPYLDETHYRLQVGYLLNNWNLDRALLMLEQHAACKTTCAGSSPSAR